MSTTTIVEKEKPITLRTNIAIRPYVSEADNMGLQNYGMVVFDGVKQTDFLGCSEVNGIKRYITGLNEFAPELNTLSAKEKAATIKQIREDIILLEKELAQNPIEWDGSGSFPYDKVLVVKSNNSDFWDKISIKLHNGAIFLDTKNPYDLIKCRAIEAGGFSLIAPSYEVAAATGKYKWYLDRFERTVSDKTVELKIRNKAISKLTDLFDTDVQRLRYVLKNILLDGASITNSTPVDALYEEADSYINGKGQEKKIRKAAETFLNVSKMKLEDLKLTAIVRDAAKHNFLVTKADGKIYHAQSTEMLGGNIEDVVLKLKNPINEKLLLDIQEKVEKEWQK